MPFWQILQCVQLINSLWIYWYWKTQGASSVKSLLHHCNNDYAVQLGFQLFFGNFFQGWWIWQTKFIRELLITDSWLLYTLSIHNEVRRHIISAEYGIFFQNRTFLYKPKKLNKWTIIKWLKLHERIKRLYKSWRL